MTNRKPVRKRGKLQLSRYFQDFEKGESVSIIKEQSLSANFPKRLRGRTGIIEGKRGKAYVVKIKEPTKCKSFLIEPIHLKKIEI